MNFKLRNYEQEAINSIFDYFTENDGNPLIALPTGTGKSYVEGGFIQQVLGIWPRQRFMVLSHVKEIIEQDAKALYRLWPTAPIGIYSAGLGQKDVMMPIIFGNIQSVAKNAHAFGFRDLLIIDEAHLLSPKDDSMYQRVIKELRVINPCLKVIGLSATCFRLGQGMLIEEGSLFTDICFDLTGIDAFNRLIAEGFICPLIPKRTSIELDVSGVSLINGDYAKGELQNAVDKQEVTYAALKELCEQGHNRRSWLIFASGIAHAEHISEILQSFGVSCTAVHSKMPSEERDRRILDFKQGNVRAISNNNMLTTGFDYPAIDLIGMLRPTTSSGLWVQMLGRATRPSPETGKINGLVLDFAGNTRRLGPINDPLIPKKKGNKTGDVPVKICEACGVYNHASVRFCINCGFEFIFQTKIVRTASSEQLLRSDMPIVEMFDVDSVMYKRHSKIGMPDSIRVSYYSGLQKFDEWICLEHEKQVGKRARDWWRQRSQFEPPESTESALEFIKSSIANFREPKRIKVWLNKKWPEVLSYEF